MVLHHERKIISSIYVINNKFNQNSIHVTRQHISVMESKTWSWIRIMLNGKLNVKNLSMNPFPYQFWLKYFTSGISREWFEQMNPSELVKYSSSIFILWPHRLQLKSKHLECSIWSPTETYSFKQKGIFSHDRNLRNSSVSPFVIKLSK